MTRHLYIHVPFCRRRCSYCDFSIAVRRRIPAGEYVAAIRQEISLLGFTDAGQERLETIYFGGGTPSLLPPEAVASLLTFLRDAFGVTSLRDDLEVSLEANPEDVTLAAAQTWRRAGVNRVSLGAQSFDGAVLKWMHRAHDAARIASAVHTLREAGISNLSLDLIFALPAELARDWGCDLERATALEPPHLSLYGLTVEERTPLARWISRGATSAPDDDRYAQEYLEAHARLAASGYHFYEVSNAARDDCRSRHNSAYWTGRPYVGLGPAAHSFDGAARRWNVAAWEAYRAAVAAGRSPVECEERLTPEQRELERAYLALRTDVGLSLAAPCRPLLPSAARWVERGWVEIRDQRLHCTPEGWLRLDALVRALTGSGEMS